MIVTIDDVRKKYRRREVLRGLSLEFDRGTTAVLGRNGAGKSTLVRLIVGVEAPSAGAITVSADGQKLGGRDVKRVSGWLPQVFGYPTGMRVAAFVKYAAWLKESQRTDEESVGEALRFAGIEDGGGRKLGALSGGTLRRVGFAAAIVHQPQLLILDEPTTGLDPMQRAVFHERLQEYSQDTTVILATHILEDVAALADRVVVIDDGEYLWGGAVDELSALGTSGLGGTEALRSGFASLLVGRDP